MSRRIDICPTCKGKGEIIVDNWLTEGWTEEELAKEKREALADIVEVVRCENCRHYHAEKGGWCERHDFEFDVGDYCCHGERREE